MIKVLVLGHGGMLGNAVCRYLNEQRDVSVVIDSQKNRWPSNSFKKSIKNFNGDYIINCIGAIPQRTNQFEVNYELPIWLDKNVDCRIIHPATDCEMDDDAYGISKWEAEQGLWQVSQRTGLEVVKTESFDVNVCLKEIHKVIN